MGGLIHLPCTLLVVGSLKSGPEWDLVQKYKKRLKTLDIIEIKASSQKEEAVLFEKHIKPSDYLIILDETGKDIGSNALAHLLSQAISDYKRFVFIIGGADGIEDSFQKKAQFLLSFGKLTWPHMLVRGMLCEQIYRIHSILNDHPYHREG